MCAQSVDSVSEWVGFCVEFILFFAGPTLFIALPFVYTLCSVICLQCELFYTLFDDKDMPRFFLFHNNKLGCQSNAFQTLLFFFFVIFVVVASTVHVVVGIVLLPRFLSFACFVSIKRKGNKKSIKLIWCGFFLLKLFYGDHLQTFQTFQMKSIERE